MTDLELENRRLRQAWWELHYEHQDRLFRYALGGFLLGLLCGLFMFVIIVYIGGTA